MVIMTIPESIILGIVQGIGEFLPISSSAHLIIAPYLFNFKAHTLSFDVMLHLGTLFALSIYFFKDWLRLAKEGFLSLKEMSVAGQERRLFWFILIATIPGAIIGKVFEEKAETVFRNPLLAALVLGVFALFFYLAQKLNKPKKTLEKIFLKDAILIGIAQGLAILPGVSRAGSTIALGLALNFKKEAAVRFSFLLSFPIIFGAGILKINDIFSQNGAAALCLWVGFIVSALSGLASIHFLLKFIKKYSFNLFIIYRIAVCLLVIGVFLTRKG